MIIINTTSQAKRLVWVIRDLQKYRLQATFFDVCTKVFEATIFDLLV